MEDFKGYLNEAITEHLGGEKSSVYFEMVNITLPYQQLVLNDNGHVVRGENEELTYHPVENKELSGDFVLKCKGDKIWSLSYSSYGQNYHLKNAKRHDSGIIKLTGTKEELLQMFERYIAFVH